MYSLRANKHIAFRSFCSPVYNVTAWCSFVGPSSNQSSRKSIKKAIKGPMK